MSPAFVMGLQVGIFLRGEGTQRNRRQRRCLRTSSCNV